MGKIIFLAIARTSPHYMQSERMGISSDNLYFDITDLNPFTPDNAQSTIDKFSTTTPQ